jgi:putative transposase
MIVHADRSAPMIAKSTALLLSDLGLTPSHSRPRVSDDNLFSEAQFKTLKYHPTFPDRFGSVEGARSFCRNFLP